MTVQLGLTPDAGWDIGVDDLVPLALKAGFSSLGILADRVNHSAAHAYQQSGMGCHELLALVVSDDEAATLSQAAQLAEKAAVIGAPWVLTVFLTSPDPKLVDRCAGMLADRRGPHGSGVHPARTRHLYPRRPRGGGGGRQGPVRPLAGQLALLPPRQHVGRSGTMCRSSRSPTSSSTTPYPSQETTWWTKPSIAEPCPAKGS